MVKRFLQLSLSLLLMIVTASVTSAAPSTARDPMTEKTIKLASSGRKSEALRAVEEEIQHDGKAWMPRAVLALEKGGTRKRR
jgi:hypothetical protein